MNTHSLNGLGVVGNDRSLRSAQQAGGVHETLMRRLLSLLDSTMRETWMPMGFRVLVVQEFPAIRRELERRRPSFESIASRVGHLVEKAQPYKAFAGRSEALVALRLLEAEVKSRRFAA